MEKRREPCPDCGDDIVLARRQLERGRARCARCALDVQLDQREVGDGPERSVSYLSLIAPALAPSRRLRVERDQARLSITLVPDSNVATAAFGLAGGIVMVIAGLAGALPLIVSAVAFVAVLWCGFILASREQKELEIVVERGRERVFGRIDGTLSEPEQRWVRAVVAARIAGDGDR